MAACATAKLDELTLSQLYLVSLHCRLEFPNTSLPLLESQHEKFRDAYQRCEAAPSQLQRDVAAALDRVGWAHVFEHVTAEGISLDMAQPDEKRGVEVDGPSHYLKGREPVQVNGSTRFKSRLLRQLGWDVVHVPFFEWDALGGVAESQDAYLRAKLSRGAT